jgi:hypothetical protein
MVRCLRSTRRTHMQAAAQFALATALDVDSLVQAELYKIERLFYSCLLVSHQCALLLLLLLLLLALLLQLLLLRAALHALRCCAQRAVQRLQAR